MGQLNHHASEIHLRVNDREIWNFKWISEARKETWGSQEYRTQVINQKLQWLGRMVRDAELKPKVSNPRWYLQTGPERFQKYQLDRKYHRKERAQTQEWKSCYRKQFDGLDEEIRSQNWGAKGARDWIQGQKPNKINGSSRLFIQRHQRNQWVTKMADRRKRKNPRVASRPWNHPWRVPTHRWPEATHKNVWRVMDALHKVHKTDSVMESRTTREPYPKWGYWRA